jgi:MFS family permease
MRLAPSWTLLRQNTGFRNLWFAQLISFTGDRASAVALLAVVLRLTGSGFLAGAVLAANMLAPLVVFPLVSVALDRLSRRSIIVAADLLSTAVALTLILVDSRSRIWWGIAAVAAISALDAFSTPASMAALPNLVEAKDLSRANALMAACQGITLGIGPLVGGVLTAGAGQDVAFIANAASFLASALLTLGIRRPFGKEGRQRARARPLGDIRQGFSYVRSQPVVVGLLASKSGFALFSGGTFVLLPVMAVTVFRSGAFGIGLLMAARGLGALVGPLVARSVVKDDRNRLLASLGLGAGLFGLAYLCVAVVPLIWLAVPFVILAHTGGFGLWTMEGYGLQLHCPDRVRGRVLALDFCAASALMGTSMLLIGRTLGSYDPRLVVAVEGLLVLGFAAVWSAIMRRVGTGRSRPVDLDEPVVSERRA